MLDKVFDFMRIRRKLVLGKGATLVATSAAGVETVVDATELAALGGVTATAAELNIMDGVTATAAEINMAADVSGYNRAVTATVGGATTGVLALTDRFVTVTSANADHIIMLPSAPAAAVGQAIEGWIGANGCEVRAAGTAATINGLDCKTTNEAALAATGYFKATVVGAETWLLEYLTELGAVTTIVPDGV
jgi:hypothetical protein